MSRVTLDHPQWKQQCVRIRKNGERCLRYAIRGSTVCYSHGGAAPLTRQKAIERIEEAKNSVLHLVDPALLRLEEMLYSDRHGVALRAALEILDRAGLATTKQSQHEITYRMFGESELDRRIDALLTEMRARDVEGPRG